MPCFRRVFAAVWLRGYSEDRVGDRRWKRDTTAEKSIQEVLEVTLLLIRSTGDLFDLIVANLFHDNSL